MKKKLLRIFLFIIMLFTQIVPSENNGPRRVEAAIAISGHIYFVKPSSGWTDSKILLMVGHSTWSQGYEMTNIANTNLYYCEGPGWGDATEFAFFNTSSVWGGESNKISNRQSWSSRYTAVQSEYNINSDNYYIVKPASGNNGASLSISPYSSISEMNNITIKSTSYYSKADANYVEGTTGGETTITSYYFDSKNSVKSSTAESTTSTVSYGAAQHLTAQTTFTATANEGYDFEGWFDSTTSSTAVSTSASYSVVVTADKTLYARFKEKSYSVTYYGDANSNEQTTYSDTKYHTTNLSLKGETYTRSGYKQTGWSTSAGGSMAYTLSDTYSTNQAVPLYPFWTANTHNITLNTNEGTYRNDYTAPSIHTYDTQTTLPTSDDITKTGYTFSGWYDNQEFTGSAIEFIPAQTDNPTEYWLKWTPNVYNISFNVNGGGGSFDSVEVTYDQTYEEKLPNSEPTPPSDQYEFGGWFIGDTKIEETSTVKITEDTALVAKWVEKVSVTFNANGGLWDQDVETQTKYFYKNEQYGFNSGSFPENPTRYGYAFDGWYTAAEGGTKVVESDTLVSNETHTLYAHWYALPCEVTFNVNGGKSSHDNINVYYDQTYGELPIPSRDGYTFNGWFTAASGGTQVTSTTLVQTVPTQTLYAQWTPINYTISYDSNGGTGEMSSTEATYNESVTLTTNSFTRTGYTFAGWNTEADGTGTSYTDEQSVNNLSSTSGATVTLYAQWTGNKYTVTLNNQNATTSGTASVTATYGSDMPSITKPTKTGYTFLGYYTEKNGEGTMYYNSNGASANVWNIDSNTELFAYWTLNEYSITYTLGENGSWSGGNNPNPTSFNINTDTFSITTSPTRSPYTFIGWTCEQLDIITPTKEITIDKGEVTENIELVANWDATVTLYIDMGLLASKFPYDDVYYQGATVHYFKEGGNSTDWNNRPELTHTGKGNIYSHTIHFDENITQVDYVVLVILRSYTYGGTSYTGAETQTVDIPVGESSWTAANNGEEYFFGLPETIGWSGSKFEGLYFTLAPRVIYYDDPNSDPVYSSTYLTNHQVKFIEKEGYRLEGWYLEETFDTLFTSETEVSGQLPVYAKYVEANDYYLYCDAKDLPWNIEEDGVNMYVYLYNSYFYEPDTANNAHENVAWGEEDYGGDSSIVSYVGNGIYRVLIDASKSFNNIIFSTDDSNATVNQTADIEMSPYHTYYILTNTVTKNSGDTDVYDIYYEENLDNFLVAQKKTSSDINEFRFTAGLETTTVKGLTTGNKEFGYKFIFIKDGSSYVGYLNFKKDHMLDCIRYEGTFNEAGVNNTYKGYYSLTLTDDITFKYGDYDQIIVIACYRDSSDVTRVIKAQEFNIVGTNDNVYLYEIER